MLPLSLVMPSHRSSRRSFLRYSASTLALAATGCVTPPTGGRLRIVDTHLHLWNLETQRLDWLAGAPPVLKRTYTLDDFHKATDGFEVAPIYMEVDVVESTLNAEAELVFAWIARKPAPILAAVIGGRPASPGFGNYIRQYSGNPAFKGVRQVLHGPNTPAGFCLQPAFVQGIRALGEIGRSFDLCMRPAELMDAARLVELCPATRFILDHCGNPDLKCFRPRRSGESEPAHTADVWRKSIEKLASRPNVICKISGVAGSLQPGGDAGDLAPAVNHCLDAFGPDRVVFGGDWPVCLLGASYRRWVEMLTGIISTRPPADQQKLWSGNALRWYGLKA